MVDRWSATYKLLSKLVIGLRSLSCDMRKIKFIVAYTGLRGSHQQPFDLTQKLFDETAIHHAVIAIGFSRESTHKRNINHFHNVNCCPTESQASHAVLPEMSIYRDKLSTIVIGDNFLSIIVIAQNNCDLSLVYTWRKNISTLIAQRKICLHLAQPTSFSR